MTVKFDWHVAMTGSYARECLFLSDLRFGNASILLHKHSYDLVELGHMILLGICNCHPRLLK